jgi:anti-sigma B factor antagonist
MLQSGQAHGARRGAGSAVNKEHEPIACGRLGFRVKPKEIGTVETIVMGEGERLIEAGMLTIRSGPSAEVCLIEVYGDLDLATVPALETELGRVESTDVQRIVLDLSGLDFIDSSGIALLLRAVERDDLDGSRLSLLRPARDVAATLRISGVDVRLPFVD